MDVELTNYQISLTGLFGELSDTRRTKIQAQVIRHFSTVVATPATGILAFTNAMTQEVLIVGPSALNYTSRNSSNLRLDEVRSLYRTLFEEGLLPETVTPGLQVAALVEARHPLQHLRAQVGNIFDLGLNDAELVGIGVRQIYRHEGMVIDVRLENNFQGEEKYHSVVSIQSEVAYGWEQAFDKVSSVVAQARGLIEKVYSSLQDIEVSA